MKNLLNNLVKKPLNGASICCVVLALSACGGSSNDQQMTGRGELPPPVVTDSVGLINPITSFGNIDLYGDQTMQQGGSYGFAITTNNNSQITSVLWQQISGPALTILARNSQTIGFDALEAGDYVLQADITTTGGSQQISHDFSVQASVDSVVNVRLDHTVTERAKVSLRVDSRGNDISTANIVWRQVAGPAVIDLTVQENRAFFVAPAVNSDQLIQFEANVTFADDSSKTDTSIITINDANINEDGYFPSNNIVATEDVFSFNPNSPFKEAIEECIYTNTLISTCTFGKLPLIGQRTTAPNIEDILNRTLVSHSWMGERFREYLEQSVAGPDMLKLLRGVTAVVISYDVRPSFYWAATGAIYLDARNFWVTPEERDSLNEVPDFRSGFSSDLQFRVLWRYVKDNEAYFPSRGLASADRGTRGFTALEADISYLMYHELGHANDFFPFNVWASLSNADNPRNYFSNNGANSDRLTNNFPLNSSEMKSIAQVSFAGDTATNTQKNYVASDIETFFKPDIASSYYSYSTEREDFATLFERFMMQYRMGASADIGIVNTENNPNLLVTWGQRDRFNEVNIQARLRFTVNNILPEVGDVAALQASLPSPVLLRSNVSWFDNVDLDSDPSNPNQLQIPFRIDMNKVVDESHIHLGRPDMPNN